MWETGPEAFDAVGLRTTVPPRRTTDPPRRRSYKRDIVRVGREEEGGEVGSCSIPEMSALGRTGLGWKGLGGECLGKGGFAVLLLYDC